MNDRSATPTMLLVAIFALLAVGVYLQVDAASSAKVQAARNTDAFRRLSDTLGRLDETLKQQDARTANALRRLSDTLGRLDETLDRGVVHVAGGETAHGTGIGRTPAVPFPDDGFHDPDAAPFANAEFRDPDAVHGGDRVGSTASFPGNMNYIITNESTAGAVWNTCISSLAERNNMDPTRYEPMMAESWDVSEDGLVYTIRLRSNVKWQAYTDPATKRDVPAKQVTSDDFLFYWETVQNPRIPCDVHRVYLELVDRIEAVDEFTLRVVWTEPYSLAEETTLGLSPLPRHYYRPDPEWSDDKFADEFVSSVRNQTIVGTGPYRFAAWDKNKELVLERDDNFFGPRPYADRLVTRQIQEPEVAFLEFESKRLDELGLTPEQWTDRTPAPRYRLVTPNIATAVPDSVAFAEAKKRGEIGDGHDFEKFQYPGRAWGYIGYNLRRPLFADRQVRLALTHLVDRDRILDEVFLGLGRIISGPFVPQSPYYDHSIRPWPFDPEEAKAILREAGWEDTDGDGLLDKDYDGSGRRKPFEFSLIVPNSSPLSLRYAAIVEQDLRAAGIRMHIKPIEWSVYIDVLDNWEFDACTLSWIGGIEGDPYQIWHSSQATKKGSSNFVGFSSPEADALIEKGRRTLDKQARYAIYRQFHAILHEEQPYTFLIAGTTRRAQSRKFMNARVFPDGMDQSLQWIRRQ